MDEVLAGQRDTFRLIVRDYGLGVSGFLAAFESLGSFRKGDELGA